MKPAEKKNQAIQNIAEETSSLIVPSLTPLHQTFIERKDDLNAMRSELLRKIETVRNEGYAAATRLMTPNAEQSHILGTAYLELIDSKRSEKNGKH